MVHSDRRALSEISNSDRDMAVALATLPPPPTKHITCCDRVVLAGEVKKKSMLSRVQKGELREDRPYDYGCNSGSSLRDAVGSLKKELIRLWNSVLCAELSKLIRLTACKKTKHTISRWYRTVYIPWLVAVSNTWCGDSTIFGGGWMNYNFSNI